LIFGRNSDRMYMARDCVVHGRRRRVSVVLLLAACRQRDQNVQAPRKKSWKDSGKIFMVRLFPLGSFSWFLLASDSPRACRGIRPKACTPRCCTTPPLASVNEARFSRGRRRSMPKAEEPLENECHNRWGPRAPE